MNNRMATIDDLKIDAPAPQARRKRRRPTRIVAVALVALVAAGASWIVRRYLSSPSTPVHIYTVPTDTAGGAGSFTAVGYLEVVPPGPLVVSAMVEGPIQAVEVIEGQFVEKGQVLARLNDVLHRQEVSTRESAVALAKAKLARLEAGFRDEEIEQARADLERAQARLRKAQLDYDRHAHLAKEGIVSKKVLVATAEELAAAKADVLGRQAELELRTRGYRKEDIAIARAELELAESELNRARWKLDACIIKAPISGVVLERFVQPGDWVSLTASPSVQRERPSAIVSLMAPKGIQAWVDVNQRDSGRVFVGQPVLLATDAEPTRTIKGRVSRILPKANLQKNTVRVNVELSEVPADLRPEMSVKVTFLADENHKKPSPVVAVPASAVVRDGSKSVVYVHAAGRAQVREIQASREAGGWVMVVSGIVPGDQVIVNPQSLADGQAVEVQQ